MSRCPDDQFLSLPCNTSVKRLRFQGFRRPEHENVLVKSKGLERRAPRRWLSVTAVESPLPVYLRPLRTLRSPRSPLLSFYSEFRHAAPQQRTMEDEPHGGPSSWRQNSMPAKIPAIVPRPKSGRATACSGPRSSHLPNPPAGANRQQRQQSRAENPFLCGLRVLCVLCG